MRSLGQNPTEHEMMHRIHKVCVRAWVRVGACPRDELIPGDRGITALGLRYVHTLTEGYEQIPMAYISAYR